jgi:hypothetical protein
MVLWYIFSRVGMMHQEKSGNPGQVPQWAQTVLTSNFVVASLSADAYQRGNVEHSNTKWRAVLLQEDDYLKVSPVAVGISCIVYT